MASSVALFQVVVTYLTELSGVGWGNRVIRENLHTTYRNCDEYL